MAKIKRIFISALLMFPIVSQAIPLPEMPSHPSHPGSAHYEFNFKYALVLVKERKAVLFLPQSAIARKFPVVVFGNGHAVPYLAYKATAEHLAKKGIAVIMPEYQKSVWDKDLQRMASDYNMLTEAAFKKYGDHLDPDRVIYSGHSYGGAVALAASGLRGAMIQPKSLVLFASATFENMELNYKNINPRTVVSLISGEEDEPESDQKIYNDLPLKYKQQIVLKSYKMTTPQIIADHGLVRTLGWTGSQVTPLHYYGVWKYLGGAEKDLEFNQNHSNTYIYGTQAASTGIDGFEHIVIRSW